MTQETRQVVTDAESMEGKQLSALKNWTIGLAVGMIVLWLANLVVVPTVFPNLQENGTPTTRPIQNPGIFGDMFGGLNALFSGLSAILVATALMFQVFESRKQERRAHQELQDQANDQYTLAEVLGETTRIQAQIADALALLAAATKTGTEQDRLRFLIEYNTRRIETLERSRKTTFTRPRDPDPIGNEVSRLKSEIEESQKQLAQLG